MFVCLKIGSHCISQVGLELEVLLPPPPECGVGGVSHVSPHPLFKVLSLTQFPTSVSHFRTLPLACGYASLGNNTPPGPTVNGDYHDTLSFIIKIAMQSRAFEVFAVGLALLRVTGT